MAIYVGNSHPTGGTDVYIGSFTPNIYIGSFLTYPEGSIRYVFQNGALHYSSGSNLYASGANYAWYTADVLTYRGNTYLSSAANVTLTATKVSGDSAFHVNANNEVYADDRTNVTGASRTATFRAAYGDTTAATFTVTQQANSAYIKQHTNSLTAYTANNYSYLGGDYYITCRRQYSLWAEYTSGYNHDGSQSASTNSETVSAMTYFDTDSYSWLSTGTTEGTGFPRKLVMDYNYATGATGNRSATIKVGYPVTGDWSDYNYVTASTEITQFGASYSTYEHRISALTMSNDTWAANLSGTAYTESVSATCEYRTTTYNGVTGTTGWSTTTGNWYTYYGTGETVGGVKPMLILDTSQQPIFQVKPYGDATQHSAYDADLYYSQYSYGVGTAGIYPVQVNGNASARTRTATVVFGEASSSITLTQLGNDSISISPSNITMPAASGATSAFTVTTLLTGWGVSADTNWLTTTVSGSNVNVTTTQNNISQGAVQRTANISVYYNGVVKATATVTQQADNYVFTALSTTAITLAATATSYSNLAVQSFAGYTPVPISNSNISITNNTMNLNISGSVTSAGTGVYYVPLTCSTNTSTTTPKHATLTITQPGSGKQIVYSFTQTVADDTAVPGCTKLADLGNGWILGAVWIANAGSSPNYEPVNMLVVVRKNADTSNRTITLTGDYVTFPPPNHQRNVVTINPNPRTYNYTAGATFQLTSLDPSMAGTYTFNGVNTTLTGVNANVSISSSSTPPSGMMNITIT